MTGPHIGSAAAPDGKLLPGGVDYLSLDAAPGRGETPFTLHVDASGAPCVRVARWK